MKIKFQINRYLTDVILFEFEKENNTFRDTVLEAIKQKANLRSANLHSANLHSANLRFANLRSANLHSANLHSADLSSADLRFTDLSFTNLSFANLSSADLSFADLRFANLRFANLRFADLSSADLRSADLRSAKNIMGNYTNFWWHIHHKTLVETLTEPLRARINYIKKEKPKDEVKLRLKLLKPVLGEIPTTDEGWEKLHRVECPKCPWDSRQSTIFPK